jgi:ligand-binding sensor domain-containing protein
MTRRRVEVVLGMLTALSVIITIAWIFSSSPREFARTQPPPRLDVARLNVTQGPPSTKSAAAKPKKNASASGPRYATAAHRDPKGDIWVATDGEGVFRYRVTTEAWQNYVERDGVGDLSCTSILCDAYGRVWVGLATHGVSVCNGTSWQNYRLPHVPVGDHVFALGTSPIDGDVWIASELGLTRYSTASDQWLLQEQRFIGDQHVTCLAFNSDGDLFCGTEKWSYHC